MSVWYNDNEPFVAKWIRNLIAAGHLPQGLVDERSIRDIEPQELGGYQQAHFFAGIGGWPLALKQAGWPTDEPIWTGSCPCQPFSVAGKRSGTIDERHLWPEWFRLIKECLPPVVFGEQVASRDGYAWFDIVQADLESLGYACGMVVSPAAGYGAPHIRHRIYFVADTDQSGQYGRAPSGEQSVHNLYQQSYAGRWADIEWLPCTDGKARPTQPGFFPLAHGVPARVGRLRAYGNAIVIPQAVEFIRAYMAQEKGLTGQGGPIA